MNKYNGKLLNATAKVSKDTLEMSTKTVQKLIKPSKKVSRIGSTVGGIIGLGLVIAGGIKMVTGHTLGIWSCIAGVTTVVSCTLNFKKNK